MAMLSYVSRCTTGMGRFSYRLEWCICFFLQNGKNARRRFLALLAGRNGGHRHQRVAAEHIGLLIDADQDADRTRRDILLPQIFAGGEAIGSVDAAAPGACRE